MTHLDDAQLDAIRAMLPDVVAQHMDVKRNGSDLLGLCPFHAEKTPSFRVSTRRNLFHCFGCGAGGDVFVFLQRTYGVDFKMALVIGARLAGFDPDVPAEDGWREKVEKRKQLRERRLALEEWRRLELNAALMRQGNADADVFWISECAGRASEPMRERWLDLLAEAHEERDAAEWLAERLAPDDERAWALLWLEREDECSRAS